MYIKRSRVLADLLDYRIKYPHQEELLSAFTSYIRDLPAEDVGSRKICHGGQKVGFREYCSECHKLVELGNFCPYCGSKVERGTHGKSC